MRTAAKAMAGRAAVAARLPGTRFHSRGSTTQPARTLTRDTRTPPARVWTRNLTEIRATGETSEFFVAALWREPVVDPGVAPTPRRDASPHPATYHYPILISLFTACNLLTAANCSNSE